MPEAPTEFLDIEALCSLFPDRTRGAFYTERSRGIGIGALGVQIGKRLYWRRSDVDAWFESKLDEQKARFVPGPDAA